MNSTDPPIFEIGRVDWSSYEEAAGGADAIGERLRALLAAPDSDAAQRIYWTLENHVVVQTTVYSAAEPVTAVLMAALTAPRPVWVTSAALDLLLLFLTGAPAESAPNDIVARCRAGISQGYWLLVDEALNGQCSDGALDVLEALDGGDPRLASLRAAKARTGEGVANGGER